MRKLSLLATLSLFLCFNVFGQSYCTPSGGDGCDNFDHLSRVRFGDLDISSGCSGGSYSHNTTLNPVYSSGMSYTLTLENSSGSPSDQMALWIDFNRDGDFFDSGELIVNPKGVGTSTTTVVIPMNASQGKTRARAVFCSKDYNISPCNFDDPSGGFNYWEVEDFDINICAASVGLSLVGDPSINCSGESELISINGNQSGRQVVRWERSNNANFNNPQTVPGMSGWSANTPVVNQDTYFRAVIRNASGCEAPTSSTVFVDHVVTPKPPIVDGLDGTSICPDASIQLTIDNFQSDTNYTWYDTTGNIIGTGQPTVSPFSTTYYEVEAEFGKQCILLKT